MSDHEHYFNGKSRTCEGCRAVCPAECTATTPHTHYPSLFGAKALPLGEDALEQHRRRTSEAK